MCGAEKIFGPPIVAVLVVVAQLWPSLRDIVLIGWNTQLNYVKFLTFGCTNFCLRFWEKRKGGFFFNANHQLDEPPPLSSIQKILIGQNPLVFQISHLMDQKVFSGRE